MKPTRQGTVLILVLLVSHVRPITARGDGAGQVISCKQLSYGLDDFGSGKLSISAPNLNGRVLLARDVSFRVFVSNREVGAVRLDDLSSNIGIGWSPDSQKFFINYSDGGAIGGFHSHIYAVGVSSVTEIPKPATVAFDDFKARYNCKARGDNIEALGWTNDSNAIVFLTQVYPTSDCAPIWAKSNGYLVSLTGSIIDRYLDREVQTIRISCADSGRAVLPIPRGHRSR